MPISTDEYRELLKLRNEQREEFRREVERHVHPYIDAARETDKSAIELGQSVLRTSTLLNGGALVAVPAVVTLFGIDAKAITPNLLIAGGIFALGLVFCWLSSYAGFFALAHRADRDFALGEATRHNLNLFYYYSNDETRKAETTAEIESQNKQVARHHLGFVRYRLVAIIFFILSLEAFVSGNFLGGWSVLRAPVKPATSGAALLDPPCKDGSETCPPWERDWGSMQLQPGSTVTKEGRIVQPKP
jgi:hypothetical protein